MSKFKVSILGGSIVASVILALLISYQIGEKYFFDKLFYKKSMTYGYSIDMWNIAASANIPRQLEKRVQDLAYLNKLYNTNTNNNVLGISDLGQDEFVIVLIGDSFVYGVGIREEERFGKLLEKKLNSIYPTKVYILAQSGDGIIENYAKFMLANKYLNPDLYIFGLVDNDLVFETYDKYPLQKDLYDGIKQFCLGEEFLWSEKLTGAKFEDVVLNQYAPSFLPQYQNVCILKNILAEITTISKKVLFYSFYQENKEANNLVTEIEKIHAAFMNQYFEAIKEANGRIIFQPNGYFWSSVSSKEGHPSVQANEAFADQLFKEITKNQYWGFPDFKFSSQHHNL